MLASGPKKRSITMEPVHLQNDCEEKNANKESKKKEKKEKRIYCYKTITDTMVLHLPTWVGIDETSQVPLGRSKLIPLQKQVGPADSKGSRTLDHNLSIRSPDINLEKFLLAPGQTFMRQL